MKTTTEYPIQLLKRHNVLLRLFKNFIKLEGEALISFLQGIEALPFTRQYGVWLVFLESQNIGINTYRNGYSIYILDADKLDDKYKSHFLFSQIDKENNYFLHVRHIDPDGKPIIKNAEAAVCAALNLINVL